MVNDTHSGYDAHTASTGMSNYDENSQLKNDQLITGLSVGFGVLSALVIILAIVWIWFHKRNEKGEPKIPTKIRLDLFYF